MNPWTRFARFNTVGAIGMGVQLGSLWFLSNIAHWHYLVATLGALALSVVHNFAWHWHWTWRDRPSVGGPASAFIRFAGANGVLSLVGNLGLMTTLVSGAHLRPVVANTVAVAVCGLLNYWIGNELVFRLVAPDGSPSAHARWRRPALSPDNARRWDPKNEAVTQPVERPSERPVERRIAREPERSLGRPPPTRGRTRVARDGV